MKIDRLSATNWRYLIVTDARKCRQHIQSVGVDAPDHKTFEDYLLRLNPRLFTRKIRIAAIIDTLSLISKEHLLLEFGRINGQSR